MISIFVNEKLKTSGCPVSVNKFQTIDSEDKLGLMIWYNEVEVQLERTPHGK